ncbi:methionine-R-sulfoxide reductase B1-B, partial [Silurus meridionalis]
MSFCSFSGKEVYKDHFKRGIYVCSQCANPLFSSRSKYVHSSPWPAFTETIQEDSVTKVMETLTAYKVNNVKTANFIELTDRVSVWVLVQVLCGKCGSGLGHEFLNDGPEEGMSRF